jgi:hypothetical protein
MMFYSRLKHKRTFTVISRSVLSWLILVLIMTANLGIHPALATGQLRVRSMSSPELPDFSGWDFSDINDVSPCRSRTGQDLPGNQLTDTIRTAWKATRRVLFGKDRIDKSNLAEYQRREEDEASIFNITFGPHFLRWEKEFKNYAPLVEAEQKLRKFTGSELKSLSKSLSQLPYADFKKSMENLVHKNKDCSDL